MSDFSVTYDEYLNKVTSVIKDYNQIIKELRSLLLQRKDIQQDILNSILHVNSESEELVRHVIDNNVNIDSIHKHNLLLDQSGYNHDAEEEDEDDE